MKPSFRSAALAAAWVVAGGASGAAAPPARGPVKVFILAGQSNMEGYGAVHELDEGRKERKGTLTWLVNDPVKSALVRPLRDDRPAAGPVRREVEASNSNFGDPAPNVAKRLEVRYSLDGVAGVATAAENETLALPSTGVLLIEKALYGDLPEGPKADVTVTVREIVAHGGLGERWKARDDVWVWFEGRKGPLSVGFGANKNLFGAELGFGWALGDRFEEQVLIIKTAWGGQSLYTDFRPPSSGGKTGPRYRQILETVRKVLENLKTEFPAYDGGGYELAGFVWWHGWNDGCDPAKAVPEYEENLVHLIGDLRRDLERPGLPVVVGELTGPWVEVGGEWGALRKAQAAAAARPEFRGNAVFVETHDFVRKEEDSPGGWPCHEFNNAETYWLVGKALAGGVEKLLDPRRSR